MTAISVHYQHNNLSFLDLTFLSPCFAFFLINLLPSYSPGCSHRPALNIHCLPRIKSLQSQWIFTCNRSWREEESFLLRPTKKLRCKLILGNWKHLKKKHPLLLTLWKIFSSVVSKKSVKSFKKMAFKAGWQELKWAKVGWQKCCSKFKDSADWSTHWPFFCKVDSYGRIRTILWIYNQLWK